MNYLYYDGIERKKYIVNFPTCFLLCLYIAILLIKPFNVTILSFDIINNDGGFRKF